MREVYFGAMLSVVATMWFTKAPSPQHLLLLIAFFVLLESACWRAAYLEARSGCGS